MSARDTSVCAADTSQYTSVYTDSVIQALGQGYIYSLNTIIGVTQGYICIYTDTSEYTFVSTDASEYIISMHIYIHPGV